MALGQTQPLKEMLIMIMSWSKGGRCVRQTTLSSHANCFETCEPYSPETLRACPLLYKDRFTLLPDIVKLHKFFLTKRVD